MKAFDYRRINKSPAVFDIVKLKWMNGEYIKAMDPDKFYEMAKPYIQQTIHRDLDLRKIAGMVQTRIEYFPDIAPLIDFFEEVPEYDPSMYRHKKMKTTEESSLTVMKEVLPVLEAQDNYTNDALYERLLAFCPGEGLQEWPGDVADPYRTVRQADDTGGSHRDPGGSGKRGVHPQNPERHCAAGDCRTVTLCSCNRNE